MTVRLPLIVGWGRAMEMIVTGRPVGAEEADACLSMFMRRDSNAVGARAFKEGRTPEWPHHGL